MAEADAAALTASAPPPLARPRRDRLAWGLWAGLWSMALILALSATVNHDESQYVAAAALTLHARPFVDFLYLQTPLQPYVFAPLVAMSPGWSFLALRLATAALGVALLWTTYVAARWAGGSPRAARRATLLLAACQPFLFAATHVRNDALPAALAGAAMLAMLQALRSRAHALPCMAAAGLALGLAASTKISYAVVAAGPVAFLLLAPAARHEGARRWAWLCALAAGGLAGALPSLAAWLAAPEAFRYGVFEYGATAPFLWYTAHGHGARLGLGVKMLESLEILALGPSLLALLLIARDRVRRHQPARPAAALLEWLILAGLVAALLPTPTWRQYFLPMEAPLFARLALVEELRWRWRWRPIGIVFLLFAIAGLASNLIMLGKAMAGGRWPVATATCEAHWIASLTPAGQAIATLSPQITLDSDRPLDPRFATGPFAYRTANAIPADRQTRLHILSPATLARAFAMHPPAAIVTGHESRANLDSALQRFALMHDYAEYRAPCGRARLFLR